MDSARLVNIGIAVGAAAIGIAILAYVYFRPGSDSDDDASLTIREAREQLDIAQKHLRDQEYQEAEQIANTIFYSSDLKDEAMVLAGECATRQNRLEDALNYYGLVQPDEDEEHIISLWASAEILRSTCNLSFAEQMYREVLRIDPENVVAHRGMATILNITGRRWESREHLFAVIQSGDFVFDDLLLLGEIRRIVNQQTYLETALELVPNDPISHVGLAQIALVSTRPTEAIMHSRSVIDVEPNVLEPHIVLGKAYLDEGFPNGFDDWRRNLPPSAPLHPEIWFIFGSHCEAIGQEEWATRCYWESVNLDPNHGPAIYRLSRLLQSLGTEEEADDFLQRSRTLNDFSETIGKVANDTANIELLERLADLTESMGRIWEACGWVSILAGTKPEQVEYERRRISLFGSLNPDLPLMLPEFDLAKRHELTRFPQPPWVQLGDVASNDQGTDVTPGTQSTLAPPEFVNVAQSVGIDFQFDNGDELDQPGMQIYQELGGAFVVCDFDLDGWPDVYLTQGGKAPMESAPDAPRDRLFRNLGNNSFQDVTDQANLGDRRFSQGAAAGDLNNDGYPDLLVCNIDENRVYLNQGDGTFVDVTETSGVAGKRWSTSCAIVDINRDGFADLYVANYAAGREPYELRCDDNGVPRACQPNQFVAELDRVYFGRGDGTFVDVTETVGFTSRNGRALGVAIGDFSKSQAMNIFVANDTTENFYYSPVDQDGGKYVDEALVRGLTGDFNGATQACMGVAVDDCDGDGSIDFFVTNFFNESNTLYQQTSIGLFEDTTRVVGLRQPSMGILGFGTQFIDPELDGWPDLIVANGHVDDYRHIGNGFQMRPQFFRNLGKGKFAETPQGDLSEYFQGEYLGRSIALLDWNRDGRQDFGVIHLDRPVALLQNESQVVGRYLHLHLVATGSARDAFGTIVEFKTADRVITKQLVGGSGYQASNQRSIFAGLGDVETIESLTVYWPSGETTEIMNPPVDSELILIEGSTDLVPLTR